MLRDKVRETDRHLRLTLDRLTEEHMKCQKLSALVQTKETQVVTILEIADRVCSHLAKIQQEDKLFKLDRFAHEEFDANLSVIRHIRMERLQEENQRDMETDAGYPMAPNSLGSPIRLNSISEDASIQSGSKLSHYQGQQQRSGALGGGRKAAGLPKPNG